MRFDIVKCLTGRCLHLCAGYLRLLIVVAATSAVASSLYGLVQTHPEDTRRPLVDFDIALTFIPALLLGVSFGGRCPLAG